MGKGKPKEDPKKKPGVPGSGGAGAGAGGAGGGGSQPDTQPRLRWEFDLPTEGAVANWKGQAIWGKIDRDAVYVESSELGSLGRVPAAKAAEILQAVKNHKGQLHGEILAVMSPKLIRVELTLV